MTNNPNISVLIPAYNEQALIAETLDQVHNSFATLSYDSYEIVVCDNNSTDKTSAIAESKRARVIFESHNQIARARNTAAQHARGKWLIFLDADTYLNPELLKATIESLESKKVCAGGALLKVDAEIGWVTRGMLNTWNRLSPLFCLSAGAFIFCLKDAWGDVGGFDEALYAAEDVSFSRRLKKWAKANNMKYHIMTETPIVTSSRKFSVYGQGAILRQFLLLSMPGALKKRSNCKLWYERL